MRRFGHPGYLAHPRARYSATADEMPAISACVANMAAEKAWSSAKIPQLFLACSPFSDLELEKSDNEDEDGVEFSTRISRRLGICTWRSPLHHWNEGPSEGSLDGVKGSNWKADGSLHTVNGRLLRKSLSRLLGNGVMGTCISKGGQSKSSTLIAESGSGASWLLLV